MRDRRSVTVQPVSMSGSRNPRVRASRSTRRTASTAKPVTSRTPIRTSPGSPPKGAAGPTTRICEARTLFAAFCKELIRACDEILTPFFLPVFENPVEVVPESNDRRGERCAGHLLVANGILDAGNDLTKEIRQLD